MKHIILIAVFFVTAFSYAQQTNAIYGNVLDIESNNSPLLYAKVLIKETGAEVLSDEKGAFKFKNLKEGTYTLVSSFVGYDTKETKIKVQSGKSAKVKIALGASTLSLDELMLTFSNAEKENTSATINK